jgi:two-component sensor histidine kinase
MTVLEANFRPAEPDLAMEANHRIANQLSLLAGMVQLQVTALAKGPDLFTKSQVHSMLQETAGKIVSVGNMHRRLAHLKQGQSIDLSVHLIESIHHLVTHLALGNRVNIVERLESACIVDAEEAQTIELIAGEILMNSVKHAHPTGLRATISVSCCRNADGSLTLEIGDDGVGLPENFDFDSSGGVGLKLIRSLAEKMGATLQIESDSLGLSYRLRLPRQTMKPN